MPVLIDLQGEGAELRAALARFTNAYTNNLPSVASAIVSKPRLRLMAIN